MTIMIAWLTTWFSWNLPYCCFFHFPAPATLLLLQFFFANFQKQYETLDVAFVYVHSKDNNVIMTIISKTLSFHYLLVCIKLLLLLLIKFRKVDYHYKNTLLFYNVCNGTKTELVLCRASHSTSFFLQQHFAETWQPLSLKLWVFFIRRRLNSRLSHVKICDNYNGFI